jgi:hypothetical protein
MCVRARLSWWYNSICMRIYSLSNLHPVSPTHHTTSLQTELTPRWFQRCRLQVQGYWARPDTYTGRWRYHQGRLLVHVCCICRTCKRHAGHRHGRCYVRTTSSMSAWPIPQVGCWTLQCGWSGEIDSLRYGQPGRQLWNCISYPVQWSSVVVICVVAGSSVLHKSLFTLS